MTGAITDEQLAKAVAAAVRVAMDPEGNRAIGLDEVPEAVKTFLGISDEEKFCSLAWAVWRQTPGWSVRDRCIVLFEVLHRLNREFGVDL